MGGVPHRLSTPSWGRVHTCALWPIVRVSGGCLAFWRVLSCLPPPHHLQGLLLITISVQGVVFKVTAYSRTTCLEPGAPLKCKFLMNSRKWESTDAEYLEKPGSWRRALGGLTGSGLGSHFGPFRESWGPQKWSSSATSSEGYLMVTPCKFDNWRDITNLRGLWSFLRALTKVISSKIRIPMTGSEKSSILHGLTHKMPTMWVGFLSKEWLDCLG